MPLPTGLPFGLRQVKLTPFTTGAATAYGTPVFLPYSRTLSFSEAESFEELRGDDSLVAIHGSGANVEWELESGGISLPAWAVLSGGAVVESGLTPNIKLTYTKMVDTEKPYFKIEGRVISDSGGDVHCIIYKAKVNDALEGEFAEGSFFLTSCSGVGVASTVAADLNKVYEFVQNETAVPLVLV
jgi:hypothetical protein